MGRGAASRGEHRAAHHLPPRGRATIPRHEPGGNVRVTALGDLAFGIAAAWGLLWVWFWSALSPLIWVGSVTDFVDRIRVLIGRSGDDVGGVATILMVVVVWAFAAEVVRVIRAAARLVVGR